MELGHSHGPVGIRLVRTRDAKVLQHELMSNRAWLRRWEATIPGGSTSFDMRVNIRRLLQQYRDGNGYPFVMEYEGEVAGQLNVWGIARGSLGSATIGYWVSERFAGLGITPTSVALATDLCFTQMGLHRMEVCLRPENTASLRVVQKLGFRYEGLRRRYIHIDGEWRDHLCFALTTEDVPQGVLSRWLHGQVPADAGEVPPEHLPDQRR
ncbi:GNAT family N-acetyltransferase [Microbacterium sp. NIBRBAC000506063]|uniref:GNAT family N-acetyltransferase n=1 Tax=Microbacterium sp. NIBRBAC000506063 TaxID=2734618 RepID=UPI001BB7B363|nr:GNAT family protein [Microbacterium sp. NIBRBAC000506063]QTV79979.1 GNAT family N-acetyltransferase [Microbacterium sp. NIBRBAC000506063]